MRYAVCILIGLLIGVIATVVTMNTLDSRSDHYPDALMHVMGHELGAASKATEVATCNDNRHALDKLSMLSNDILVAMPDDGVPDRVFHQYAKDLQEKVELARQSDCANRKQAVKEIKDACSDCHRDYRS